MSVYLKNNVLNSKAFSIFNFVGLNLDLVHSGARKPEIKSKKAKGGLIGGNYVNARKIFE